MVAVRARNRRVVRQDARYFLRMPSLYLLRSSFKDRPNLPECYETVGHAISESTKIRQGVKISGWGVLYEQIRSSIER